jgi:hypothetical protein
MESAQAQSGFAGKFNMRAKRDAFEQGQRDAQRPPNGESGTVPCDVNR